MTLRVRFATLLGVSLAVLAAATRAGEAQCEVTELEKLVASDAATADEFGSSVAIDGNLAIVGAEDDDDNGSRSGAAYIFEQDPETGDWSEVAKLVPSDSEAFDQFGTAVAISGNRVIVGANEMGDFEDAGAAYIFQRDSETGDWIEQQKLTASDATMRDEFGIGVAIDGDTVVVGAHRDDSVCPENINCDSGAAYVFEFDSDTMQWVETQKLTNSDSEQLDGFGRAVAVHGDVLIASCHFDDDVCPGDLFCNSGSVYAFVRDPETGVWSETAKITASDAARNDQFGFSLDLDGDYAIIGSVLDDVSGTDSGSAYVFSHVGGENWEQEEKLISPAGAPIDWFGFDVALRGDLAVASTNAPSLFGGTGTSDAFVYQRAGAQWNFVAMLSPSDAGVDDQFGYSVDFSETAMMIGSLDDDHDGGNNAGSAYFFEGLSDCNGNGQVDLCDIADGTSLDENGNGVPDECEGAMCPEDLDGSGTVDVFDLLALIADWGMAESSADLNGDGTVDVFDLLALLDAWGPCP